MNKKTERAKKTRQKKEIDLWLNHRSDGRYQCVCMCSLKKQPKYIFGYIIIGLYVCPNFIIKINKMMIEMNWNHFHCSFESKKKTKRFHLVTSKL